MVIDYTETMTFTETLHQTLSLMAGPAWAWDGTGSRPTSDVRVGLFAFLTDYAQGVCAFCGQDTDRFEACHIIAAGPKRKGYVAGNIVMGCLDCNEIDKAPNGGFRNVTFESIARTDLIPTMWPAMSALAKRGIEIKKQNDKRREIKREIRGM